MLKKNMPWHIRVSRAVACDNLQPRVNAHHWHIRAFFIGELPPNFLLQKTLSAQANYVLFQECLLCIFHILFYTILLPFAVILNFAPSISHARRHMSMRCKKISKYSSMEQMFSSIFKFRVITFFSSFTFNFASVTA